MKTGEMLKYKVGPESVSKVRRIKESPARKKPRKLFIQIPCYNEEKTLPITISELPKKIEGIDEIEVLIINDGSTDNTEQVARELGIKHIVSFTTHRGLAQAFVAGINRCLELGADIIVNTDADNQYCADDIEKLVEPIIRREADMVIGDRQVDTIQHFSPVKKLLQKAGSWVIRKISQTPVTDVTSGFRALSREAAIQINVFSRFTYTLETVIQAGNKNLAVKSVKVRTNPKTRESRLFKSIPDYLRKSLVTVLRVITVYRPFRIFTLIGSIVFAAGFVLGMRYVVNTFILEHPGRTYMQSVVLSGVLLLMGVLIILIGFLADLIAVNRGLNEEILQRVKKLEYRLNGVSSEKDE